MYKLSCGVQLSLRSKLQGSWIVTASRETPAAHTKTHRFGKQRRRRARCWSWRSFACTGKPQELRKKVHSCKVCKAAKRYKTSCHVWAVRSHHLWLHPRPQSPAKRQPWGSVGIYWMTTWGVYLFCTFWQILSWKELVQHKASQFTLASFPKGICFRVRPQVIRRDRWWNSPDSPPTWWRCWRQLVKVEDCWKSASTNLSCFQWRAIFGSRSFCSCQLLDVIAAPDSKTLSCMHRDDQAPRICVSQRPH